MQGGMTIKEFLKGRNAQIRCMYKGHTVRTIVFQGDVADICTSIRGVDGTLIERGETVGVSVDMALRFEPWTFDRGSILFQLSDGREGKLCTEADTIVWDDGETAYAPGAEAW
jgi:hypothetical protein